MPVSIHVEADSGVAIGTCSGILGLADAKDGASKLWENPAWNGLAVVWDFRHGQLDTSSPEIVTLAKFIIERQRSPAPARVAFVVARDVDYGQARIFEVFREQPSTELHVFRDFDDALDWARAAARPK